MYPISAKLVKSIQAERRSAAAKFRQGKQEHIKVRREKRRLQLPIPVAELLRRLAVG